MSDQPRLVDARVARGIGARKPGQLESRSVHHGRIVHLSVDTARFPDGTAGELELIRHSGAAAVVPLLDPPDAESPRVVLVRQFRYAAGGELLEVPAGRPDREGEPWEDVAARELEEETGFSAGRLDFLTTIYTTPGFTDERIHLFLATDLTPGRTRLDQDEFVEVVTLTLDQVLDAIRDGTLIDAKSVAAILYFAAFR